MNVVHIVFWAWGILCFSLVVAIAYGAASHIPDAPRRPLRAPSNVTVTPREDNA